MLADKWENISLAGAYLVGFTTAIVVMVRLYRIARREANRPPDDDGA